MHNTDRHRHTGRQRHTERERERQRQRDRRRQKDSDTERATHTNKQAGKHRDTLTQTHSEHRRRITEIKKRRSVLVARPTRQRLNTAWLAYVISNDIEGGKLTCT